MKIHTTSDTGGASAVSRKARAAKELKDLGKSLLILILVTLLGFVFDDLGFSQANIITIYILGVLISSIITSGMLHRFLSSLGSVLVFNFFFIEPKFTLWAYDKDYPLTFLVMFIAALLTGTLAARERDQARLSAQAANRAKNEQMRADLLRAISHDLRTPLTSISGHASILLSDGEDLDAQARHQMYTDIYDDSMWLINLVENMLAVTRIEDGRMQMNPSTELVEEVIEEALQHVDRKYREHHIAVENEDELLLARMDARLIVQVLINLVDNAIKYTPAGSHIWIRSSRQGQQVRIQVEDDGPGIDDEAKQHVFEMFYSGAHPIADSRRSLGLGLSLCKSIVNAHGGEITVADRKPQGTVFSFTLPAGEVTLHE